MVERCPTCGARFDSTRGLRVHHSAAHDERLPNRECAACGTEFYSEHERRYCSEDCRDDAVSFEGADNPNWDGGEEVTACALCGDSFRYYPSEKPGHYCPDCVESEPWQHEPDITGRRNPRWSGGREAFECDNCDANFERYPGRMDGDHAFCSRECQYEWLSEAFTGEDHPNWAGGGTPNYRGDWREVRREALDRDGHECVVCGADREELGRNPDVHHLVPIRAFAESPAHDREDAHRLDNVVCLCPACHRRAEFGRIDSDRLRDLVGLDDPSDVPREE